MGRTESSRTKGKRQQRRARGGPGALVAWLSRPLASFHLILATCGLLTTVGVVMVLSASSVQAYDIGEASSVYDLFERHLISIGVGAVAFYIALRMPIRIIKALAPTGMVIGLLLLILVLTPLGTTINGSQGWFTFGSLSMQPVELAKIALALWGAHILVAKYNMLHQWRHLLVPLLPAALLMFALVMAQPDLGGTVTLAVVLLALLYFAGAPKRLFAVILTSAVAGMTALALVADYRMDRVMSFLSLSDEADASSYQATQALYALADGGLFGEGLGQGAAKWDYLPNVYHDFIFALIGEELGLVGCLFVIGLYVLLTVVGLRIAYRNLDPWIRIVSGTLTVWLVIQAAINIGYVVRLLPVTGVTLPLISYGGTSMVVTMLIFGLLANAARHEPEAVAALRTQGPGKFGWLLRLPAPEPYKPPTTRTRGSSSATREPGRQARGRERRTPAEYGQRSGPRTGSRARAGNARSTRKGPR